MERLDLDLGALRLKLPCNCGDKVEIELAWFYDDGLFVCPACGERKDYRLSRTILGEQQAELDDRLLRASRHIAALKKRKD